ncbi:S8 family peptidase [Calidithermus roseus]|uniref:Extracellular basic protease n=1 Tax=Calidithermus roseus TaxID=1644118 RepID=A0A399EY09_9DEIN|nr:S8 family peptidase [Calidithermus roseus]RIH89474.1 Extracellular basic protease [Calidithermus roseus]
MQLHRWVGVLAALGLLAACNPQGGGGDISGQVSLGSSIPQGATGDVANRTVQERSFSGLSFAVGAMAELATEQDFVPGELIVRFRPSAALRRGAAITANGVQLGLVRDLGLENTQLLRAAVRDKQATLELLKSFQGRGDVLYAQLNYIRRAFKTPNDEFYSLQWHYPAMKLPQAWDLETGTSSAVTVAVIDTGILSSHPDFTGKLLPGYDFISDPNIANDGNGRDNNPEDPGDEPGGQGSYHGSHVAGTVAATTNEGKGVAGVSWGAKILPVRVLGVGGGTDADILDAILWSAGLSVSGVPANSNPAQVINMSLGGQAKCSDFPLWQDAINKANAKGSIIVVAAGNENMDASGFIPASCTGVITVGATETRDYRSPYSNYGTRIDVMAPGGDTSVDRNGDGYADGVLSPIRRDSDGAYIWAFYQGTSMASPHVAGLVALMKSKKPSLTRSEALTILKQTARPLTAQACGRSTGADCGAGLVDAAAALQALSGPSGSLKGTQLFACYYLAESDSCDPGKSQTLELTQDGSSAPYKFSSLSGGDYVIYGLKDVNKNGKLDAGDYLGFYQQGGQIGLVKPGASGANFTLELVSASGSANRALERLHSLRR